MISLVNAAARMASTGTNVRTATAMATGILGVCATAAAIKPKTEAGCSLTHRQLMGTAKLRKRSRNAFPNAVTDSLIVADQHAWKDL